MNMEMREAMLVEEHARDLHSFNGQDLLVELEELCACMSRVEDERTIEAGELS
jgi:hypothetical protein